MFIAIIKLFQQNENSCRPYWDLSDVVFIESDSMGKLLTSLVPYREKQKERPNSVEFGPILQTGGTVYAGESRDIDSGKHSGMWHEDLPEFLDANAREVAGLRQHEIPNDGLAAAIDRTEMMQKQIRQAERLRLEKERLALEARQRTEAAEAESRRRRELAELERLLGIYGLPASSPQKPETRNTEKTFVSERRSVAVR